jgi:CheY-like chemotaxis protein
MLRDMGYTNAIVALTANNLVGSEEKFLLHGFDGFISKPINLRLLDDYLREFVRDKHPDEAIKYEVSELQEVKEHFERFDISVKPHDDVAVVAQSNQKTLEVFLNDTKKAITTLRESSENGDIKLFTTTALAMRLALQSISESEAAEIADSLERAGLRNDIDFIKSNLDVFTELLEMIMENLQLPEIKRE